jgi:hypothetical protein
VDVILAAKDPWTEVWTVLFFIGCAMLFPRVLPYPATKDSCLSKGYNLKDEVLSFVKMLNAARD